jgi:acyl-coenzyme A synthetase/AMP-(fatty) acid ligase
VSANFPVQILERLSQGGATVAFVVGEEQLSAATVHQLVVRYSARMAAAGVGPGSRVVIASRNGPVAYLLGLAVTTLGGAFIDWHPLLPATAIGVTHFFHFGALPAGLSVAQAVAVDASWAAPSDLPVPPLRGYRDETEIAMVAVSSGSTGRPKFIARPASWTARVLAVPRAAYDGGVAILFPPLSLPAFTIAGWALFNGLAVHFPDLSAALAGQMIASQRRGASVVIGSPAQLDEFVGRDTYAPKFQALIAGGAPVSRAQVLRWLTQATHLTIGYGNAEGAISASARIGPGWSQDEVGYGVLPSESVEIVDELGTVVPVGEPGELRCRSPAMAAGYEGDVAATRAVFRDGWFYPGDLARMRPDGRFVILGRTRDTINLGGVKLNALDLDLAAASVADVVSALSFPLDREDGASGRLARLGLVLVKAPGASASTVAAAVRAACLPLVGAEAALPEIRFIDSLPLGPTGKPRRQDGPQLFSAGSAAPGEVISP